MSENPEDWRSTVDPTTGRTYWYHRKTRVSTWVQPDFIEPHNSAVIVAPPVQRFADRNVKENIQNENNQSSFSRLLSLILKEPSVVNKSDLDRLLIEVGHDSTLNSSDASTIISGLVRIVIKTCDERITVSTVMTRQTALRCLWTISIARRRAYAAEHFYKEQSWTALFQYAICWIKTHTSGGNSPEDLDSFMLFSALISNLLIGPTFYVISDETRDRISVLLKTIRNSEKSLNLSILTSSIGGSVISDQALQSFALLAEKGHRLPAEWVLTVFTHALRNEKDFAQVIESGALQAVQQISLSNKLQQETRAAAKKCLLNAMSCCEYVRERILDSLLSLGRDLCPVPAPMGPDPVLYSTLITVAGTGTGAAGFDDDEDADGVDGETAAQLRYREIATSGQCDIPVLADPATLQAKEQDQDQEEQISDVWNLFNRDVEWIPKSGTPWRLSSAVLWARCPALRELISGFWDEGGGGLELSIDASDETLACLCRYMHTGLLTLPLSLSRQLQLLRVASELGMESLYYAAVERVEQKLTMDSVAIVIAFSAEHGFEDLERSGRDFLGNGGKHTSSVVHLQATDGSSHNSGYLRDAIFSSLHDVNAVLSQHPPSLAKLKVEAHTASAAASQSQSLPSTQLRNEFERNLFADKKEVLKTPFALPADSTGALLQELDQPDEFADPYEMSQLSLLDIAAAEGSLSRGNSYSRDASALYGDVADDFADEGMNISYDHQHRPATNYNPSAGSTRPLPSTAPPSRSSSSAGAKPGKKKSGGIYGLLLQSNEEAQLYEPPTSGVAQVNPKKMPGRVVGDKPRTGVAGGVGGRGAPTSGRGRGGAGPAAGRGGVGGGGSAVESTPRTQRATSLLASARPSAHIPFGDEYAFDGGGYADQSFDEDRVDYEGHAGSERDGPQEFITNMSLAPARPLTPSEKRLERLSRPAKVATSAMKKKSVDDSIEDDPVLLENTVADGSPSMTGSGATRSEAIAKPDTSDSPKPQPTRTVSQVKAHTTSSTATASSTAETVVAATAAATAAATGDTPAGLVALKRSVSPSTSQQNSRDGHLLSIGGNTALGGAASPARPIQGDINVRGSLTLLKTKGASSRRRRSVADIEAAQGAGKSEEDSTNVPDLASARRQVFPDGDSSPTEAIPVAASAPAGRPPQPSLRNPPHRVTLDLTGFTPEEDEGAAATGIGYGGDDGDGDGTQRQMMQCPDCSRRFLPGPYEKHVKICAQVFLKKRKAFDSSKMRIEGNPDLKEFVEHTGSAGTASTNKRSSKPTVERKNSTQKPSSGGKWKDQSEAFRAAMKSAREVSAAIASGAPLPPPTVSAPDPSLVQCQHCGRRFNAQAAERHINVCQSIRAKPAALKRGGGVNASNGAGSLGSTSSKSNRGWQ